MLKYLLFIVILLITVSCEYPLDDIVDSGARPVLVAPPFDIETNFEGDTAYVHNFITTWLRFRIDSVETLGYVLMLDGDTVKTSNYPFKKFEYEIVDDDDYYDRRLSPGIHNLRLDIFTRSGSGSMTDQMGLEGFVYSRLWYVNVAEGSDFLNFRIDTSSSILKIRWDKFNYPDSSYYIFLWYWDSGSNPLYDTIPDIGPGYVEDPTYVGVPHTYKFMVRTDYGTYYAPFLHAPWDLPASKGITYEDGSFYLNWAESKYQGLISAYNIKDEEGLDTMINDPDCRKFKVNEVGFRAGKPYWVIPVSKYDTNQIICRSNLNEKQAYTTDLSENLGMRFTLHSKLSDGNIMVRYGDDNLYYLYNPSERQIIRSFTQYFFSISPDGKYGACYTNDNGEYYINLYNLNNDQLVFKKKSSEIFGENKSYSLKISNNLIGVVETSDGILLAYDFAGQKVIASKEYTQSSLDWYEISPNGIYVYAKSNNNSIYDMLKLQDGKLVKINEVKSSLLKFFNNNDDKAVIWLREGTHYNTHIFKILDISTGSEKTIYKGEDYFKDIDYINEEFVVYYSGQNYFDVLDFDGNIKFSIKAYLGSDKGLTNQDALLVNKLLIQEYGYLLDMREYY